MNKTVKLAAFLGIVSAISALCVSLVFGITDPIIQENLIAAEKANLELMVPGGEFSVVDGYKDESGLIEGIYEVKGQGYIFKLTGYGYSSTQIVFLAGLNEDGTVYGLVPLQQQETSGYGSRCFEQDYINKLCQTAAGTEFDTLSGASLTSGALVSGLNAARTVLAGLQ